MGFTLHSLRHTFITDLMDKTGNDVATVMKYSGHKSLEAFRAYLHETEQGTDTCYTGTGKRCRDLGGFRGKQ